MPIDSVVIEDPQKEGKAFLNNFAYDLNNDNAVLAYQYKDKFEVYKILSNNKLDLICSVQGNELVNENEIMYFSDATIVGNRIYLLSQRHVDLAQEKGYSSVEVYDLAGKALKNYKLNFIASQMRIDKSNETIYLLSATDGMLEKLGFHNLLHFNIFLSRIAILPCQPVIYLITKLLGVWQFFILRDYLLYIAMKSAIFGRF